MFANRVFPVLPAIVGRRLFVLLLAGAAVTAHAAHQPIPAFADVRAGAIPSTAVLLARDGTPLTERRIDLRVRRLEWVALPHLSPALKEALLAAEDKRFYEHSGVDWRAFASSIWHNLWYDRKRGASTLSMQLAGLLDPELALGRDGAPRRSIGQKWDQALAAQALEARWTKEQILEAYLNLAPFRGDLQGVHAASRALFGKSPGELGRPEALILAVLLRGPNARAEVVAKRACVLATRINASSACAPAERLADTVLDRQHIGPRWDLAPHLGRQLLQWAGERLVTTVDAEAQRNAQLALQRLGASDVAAVVIDNASADVLAYVGAPDGGTPDQVRPARGSGNLLWPFAYGLAFERRQLTAASLLDSTPSGDVANNHIEPRLWASARRALAENLAEPAQTVLRLTADPLVERLRQADVEVPHAGVVEVSLLQLAGLYRSLASGGLWLAPRALPGGERTARRMLRADAAFIVGDILATDADGVAQAFAVRQYSQDGRDSLVVGYSDRFTVAVWSGSHLLPTQAGMAWNEIMRSLQRSLPAPRPLPPPGVVSAMVSFEPPIEAPRREWFIRGTETERVVAPHSEPRIQYPANGSLVDGMALATDPAFRVHFEGLRLPPGAWWRLNGERLEQDDGKPTSRGRVTWRPVAGRHTLDLMSADDKLLDSVTFAVRAPLQSASQPAQQQPHRE